MKSPSPFAVGDRTEGPCCCCLEETDRSERIRWDDDEDTFCCERCSSKRCHCGDV